jgi:hypothetical protein
MTAGKPATPPTLASRLKRARTLLALGASSVAVGIGLAGTDSRGLGAFVLVTGWLTLTAGIHAFGRSGADG